MRYCLTCRRVGAGCDRCLMFLEAVRAAKERKMALLEQGREEEARNIEPASPCNIVSKERPLQQAGDVLTDMEGALIETSGVFAADTLPGDAAPRTPWLDVSPTPRLSRDADSINIGDIVPETPIPAIDTTTKPSNPKDVIGADKIPLHLWPATATALGSMALLDGALKYGRANWRHAGVRASIYIDAANRHMAKWFEGQDVDPDNGLPELAMALACLAILVDAQAAGKLVDDRQTPGGFVELLAELTPHVARLKAMHAHRNPKHYTIADEPSED